MLKGGKLSAEGGGREVRGAGGGGKVSEEGGGIEGGGERPTGGGGGVLVGGGGIFSGIFDALSFVLTTVSLGVERTLEALGERISFDLFFGSLFSLLSFSLIKEPLFFFLSVHLFSFFPLGVVPSASSLSSSSLGLISVSTSCMGPIADNCSGALLSSSLIADSAQKKRILNKI